MGKGKPSSGPLNVTGSKRDETFNGTEYDDYIDGAGGDDNIYGNGGNDMLLGGDGRDFIIGGEGSDTIYGGAGDDWLHGDLGADTIWGGGGADSFGFNYLTHSRADLGIDTIMDFEPWNGDTLQLRPLDADEGFQLVAPDAATGQAQQATLKFIDDGSHGGEGYTVLNLYLADGDTIPDMTIHLVGQHLTADGMVGIIPMG